MRDIVNKVRTSIKNYNGYVYIPDLRYYMQLDNKEYYEIINEDNEEDIYNLTPNTESN